MTPEKQRIAIAEACGWTEVKRFQIQNGPEHPWFIQGKTPTSWKGKDVRPWLPDFLNDLNAMHEAERALKDAECEIYMDTLTETSGGDVDMGTASFCGYFATAAQRAEAFLRTLGLWEESK